ncbi:hypothetical protein [Streptomyces zaehneri]|uniref:hypothetical protein n=1 Tax=Streptomyces zaehneri TaxID=3051180 RepID=UPI0028D80B97|nr:hypothetical protein [Streptomyces sp. DSM 40713]
MGARPASGIPRTPDARPEPTDPGPASPTPPAAAPPAAEETAVQTDWFTRATTLVNTYRQELRLHDS